MTGEAQLADTGAGLVPQDGGWFVLNVRDAGWMRSDVFGARCTFEADGRIVKERPELEVQQHLRVGFPPRDAYAPFPHWRVGRPQSWNDLPWS